MKKIFLIILFTTATTIAIEAQTTELKGVTFGLGMGYSYLTKAPNDFYLTTDAAHKLQVQALHKSSIVISSMITIKLSKLATQEQEDGSREKKVLVSANRTKKSVRSEGIFRAKEGKVTNEKPCFKERLAINISLNLAEINSNDISFNKSIDGGIGLGYFVNDFTQVALFYDMMRVRQLRDYIVDNYKDKSIPNGTEVLNALDQTNNNLFYNKYFSGVSLKVIFALGK
jgi:hypothetical protein